MTRTELDALKARLTAMKTGAETMDAAKPVITALTASWNGLGSVSQAAIERLLPELKEKLELLCRLAG